MLLKNRYQEKEPSGLDQIFAIITWQIFVSRIRKGLRDSLKEVPSLGQADRIIYIFRIPWCFQNPALDCIGSLFLSQFQVFPHKNLSCYCDAGRSQSVQARRQKADDAKTNRIKHFRKKKEKSLTGSTDSPETLETPPTIFFPISTRP